MKMSVVIISLLSPYFSVCVDPYVFTQCIKHCRYCHDLQPDCRETDATPVCVEDCDCPFDTKFNGTHCIEPVDCHCIKPGTSLVVPVCRQ